MKILVVGGGGREHALVYRLVQSGHEVIAAPGNPGIEQLARCLPITVDEHVKLAALALAEAVDLVVVGPEAPLVAGLADELRAKGVPTFGPGAQGARLEGSKAFSKEFFARHRIPTAPFAVVTTVAEADAAIDRLGSVVVKVDGLAAGKGVVVASDPAEARAAAREMLETQRFGAAGARVIVEKRIIGREVSVLALTDGTRLDVLPATEDHKTIFDGDTGPNTGGMGTVSPSWASEDLVERITTEILEPTVAGLAAEGISYRGVLYAGVMVDAAGTPWLLEYNCRFGDPETQPIMARMKGDLGAVLLGAARGEMPLGVLGWDPRFAVCVVVAAAGYPGAVRTGDPIGGLDHDTPDVVVFHAGTAHKDGGVVSAGGRVLGVTALGISVEQARTRAYGVVDRIELAGKQVRRDIGARARLQYVHGMPHIAGIRGVLPEASKVGEVIAHPIELAKGLAAGTLRRDPTRAVYRYHQTFAGPGRTFVRKSFVCAVRLSPWAEGMVRPHEGTSESSRAAALATIRANQGHTSFVLAGVRDTAGEVERLFRRAEATTPTIQTTTPDGVHHTLWRVSDAEVIGKLRNYFTPRKLHVLDGHDLYEAMLGYQAELTAKQEPPMYSSVNYGLFCIVPLDDQALVAAARHKVIRGITMKSDEVLAAAKKHFIVEKLPGASGDVAKLVTATADSVAHQPAFIAVFAGEADAWKLTLSPDVSPVHEGVTVHRAMAKLDPVVVQHMFIERLLPGAQVTTETDAKKALGAGGQLTLIVRPMSIEQIAHVDELGQTLPAHSTAIYPPMANGLVSYFIDPDEDLV